MLNEGASVTCALFIDGGRRYQFFLLFVCCADYNAGTFQFGNVCWACLPPSPGGGVSPSTFSSALADYDSVNKRMAMKTDPLSRNRQ